MPCNRVDLSPFTYKSKNQRQESLFYHLKMQKRVSGLRRVRLSQAAPLFFKDNDVMASIMTNEVTVFHSEWRQWNVPVGLKKTLSPAGEDNTRIWFKCRCVSTVAMVHKVLWSINIYWVFIFLARIYIYHPLALKLQAKVGKVSKRLSTTECNEPGLSWLSNLIVLMIKIQFGVRVLRRKTFQRNDLSLHSGSVFVNVQRFVGGLTLIYLHSGIPLECKQVI